MAEAKIKLPSKLLPHILSFFGLFSFDVYDREEQPDFWVGKL